MNIKNVSMKIRGIILDEAQKNNQILHGSRAYNIQSPTYLQKETKDYDLLTKKPKKAANKLAEKLRRVLGKDVEVSKGLHQGTYKVKVDNETIADYTQMKKVPKTVNSWGLKVKSIKSIKGDAQRLIKKPEAEFRRGKDLDTLERIKKIEKLDKDLYF